MKNKHLNTVGDFREAMKDLPDDQFIHSQVVGEDNSAWNVGVSFNPAVKNTNFNGEEMSVLQMSHPQIKTLNFDFDKITL